MEFPELDLRDALIPWTMLTNQTQSLKSKENINFKPKI